MAKLYFKVGSDWEEVVRLRNEIAKLKQELMSMDGTQSPAAFKALNVQLAASNQRLDELVTNAAKAGAEMETGFKRKIFDASQSVNGFTEKIIAQKNAIGSLQTTIRKNKELYKNIVSRGGEDKELLNHISKQERALGKERDALFNLTQQQAEARLSVKKLRDEYTLYKNDGKQVVETNEGIAISWKKALAVIGGAGVLKALGSEMIRVRGEFQSMQTAIETMVGKDMAGQLIPQIKELAKISPLTMSDMVGAEKMMLGFNIQAEDTIKYLKAISDISMGESGKFNSLTLAFSQMSAAGKLMGQDLNQMINAGFNPLQQISEKTGKSIATLKDEMSKGAVSAEMVQQAFIDATSAGGKFYNMSENASKTINGQLSMMQDAREAVFNELGTKSEGVIMKGIQVTTSLIENYETVGKVLVGLIATYGTYRTAVMLVTAAESKHTLVEIGLTNARILARKAQLALNASMLTNPYVALATVVMGLTVTMWAMSDSTTAAARAQKEYNDIKNAASKKEQEHRQKIEELLTAARDESLATLTRQKSLEELRKEYPKIFERYDIEKLKLEDILKLKQQINEEDAKQSVQERKNDYISLKQTASKQQRYLQLFDNPDLRKNMSKSDMQIWRMFAGKQSYVQVREQMEKNSELLKRYQKDVLDDNISAYKANLKNYSKERLEAELELAQSSASKRNGFVVNGMMVKGGDLEGVISSINGALAEKKSPTTYKQDYEKAKKDWEDAKKKLTEMENDKSKFTSKQYEEAKKRVETTEKAYMNLGGITGSSLTKQENQAEKLRKQTDKYDALLDKQSLEQQRSAEDLQMEVDEARIKAMDEGSAKTIAEMELNFEKEMQAIDRQKEDALRKKVEDARAAWEANPKNKGKSFNATDIKLSDDEQNYYDELYKTAIISNEKIYKDLAERYLSYADERLAIEKKFNDDISILQEARKKAETKGDASEIAQIDRSIEKRTEIKNEDIFKLDAEQFKKNMNWEQVFGNLDKVSTDTLKKLKANLKDFISSQKDLSPESLKELVDAIERIDDKVSERDPFETMSISFKSLKEVTDAQREAQKAYNKALEEGTDEEKKNAKATLESAKNSKQKALYEATDALHKGINEIGQYVDAGNQVIGIMETLGIKTPEWMEGTMSGFGEMLNGLGNIDLMKPMSIITGSLQTVKGALTSVISLGGLIPGLDGADYSHYNEMVEEYNKLNEIWDELIDKKLEYINTSYGAEADKVGKEALELVNKSIEAYRILGRERLNSGASAGSHSIGKRMAKNTSSSDWQDIADALDMSVKDAKDFIGTGRMTGLFDLTTEQLEKLKSEAPTFWAKLDGDVRDYLDKIIEGEERIEEIHNQINEQLTQTTFDGVYSNFIDTLMDMKASSKDAAEDVSEYFMQAMLSEQIGTLYQDKLKKWYEKFAKGMEDGSLTESERNALNSEYMGYIEEAMKLRDELAAATGYDKISQESTSQPSTSRGFGTEMTHEDAGELSGRFTALQIAGEEIKNQSTIQSQSLNLLTVKADALLSINTETRNIADDTRNLIAQSYLELVQISENTGAIVKPIQQMQRDIAEVKKNTAKL
jgi:putative tape measure domain protein|nr:MAG TPA: tail tape measure protein [Caudoviricetes sp.]